MKEAREQRIEVIGKRMKSKSALFNLIFILVLTFFSGCKKTGVEYGRAGKTVPEYGDYYIAASIGDASYLNPILATDNASGTINGLVYNGLVKYDKNVKITGDLAKSWVVAENGLQITFYLRNDVKWHDGKPFTAEDVKFTYKKLVDPNVKTPFSGDFMLVRNVKVIDPYTLQVNYKETFAPALESWAIGIIPKHIFENGDFNNNPANRKPVGTGPFRFKEWKTDEKIVLESNPDYFEGKPYIDKYIFRIIPDQSVEFLELRNGSVDESSLTPDQWKAYSEFFAEYNKFRYPSFAYTYLAFNFKNPLFAEKEIRKAISIAINKDDIINGVLLGMGKAATGPFLPQSWAYNTRVHNAKYDPQKAQRILKQLGWEKRDDGYLYKDGRMFEFTIITNQGNKLRSLTAEIIQSQLKQIGVKVNVRIIEWSAFIHNFVDKKDFDAILLGWGLARDPDQYAIWHSKQTGEGQYNFISYSNPEVDKLLEDGRRTFNFEKRKEIYNKVHELLNDDQPYIFLYYPESLIAVHKRFRGPEVSPIGLGWNFFKWWVPAEEQKYQTTPRPEPGLKLVN